MSDEIWRFPEHSKVAEPELLFSPDRAGDRHIHPLRGLLQFGPYSRNFINRVFARSVSLRFSRTTSDNSYGAYLTNWSKDMFHGNERTTSLTFPAFIPSSE